MWQQAIRGQPFQDPNRVFDALEIETEVFEPLAYYPGSQGTRNLDDSTALAGRRSLLPIVKIRPEWDYGDLR